MYGLAGAAALATTVAIPLAAPLRYAYPAPSLHVALETGTALIGLVATAIVVRGWRDGQPENKYAEEQKEKLEAKRSATRRSGRQWQPGAISHSGAGVW